LDIVAGIIELFGLLLIGKKNRLGFIVFMVANMLWTFLSYKLHIYGLMLVTIPAMALNCYNFRKWKYESK